MKMVLVRKGTDEQLAVFECWDDMDKFYSQHIQYEAVDGGYKPMLGNIEVDLQMIYERFSDEKIG